MICYRRVRKTFENRFMDVSWLIAFILNEFAVDSVIGFSSCDYRSFELKSKKRVLSELSALFPTVNLNVRTQQTNSFHSTNCLVSSIFFSFAFFFFSRLLHKVWIKIANICHFDIVYMSNINNVVDQRRTVTTEN